MSTFINTDQIDIKEDMSQYSADETAAYLSFGYRYIGDSFRPHITLGRTKESDKTLSAELGTIYDTLLKNRLVQFDRLVFYRAGDFGVLAEVLQSVPIGADCTR
jgi:2'-5' RNA ligase